MEKEELNKKIANATKWSSITEIVSKLVVPITNMILARILAPEAFGIIATVTMIISFVDIFTDAGFQKYLIQRDFKSKVDKYRHANVAFWTNLAFSCLLWILISLYSNEIANFVGNPELGLAIIIACIQLPLTAFSSIQMALFRRSFDYKTLFLIRSVSILMPFVVTIPLAAFGFGYWSLIYGTLSMQVVNVFLLTIKSEWKPEIYYSLKALKRMFKFSSWSLVESVAIWLTVWVDTFIITYFLNEYYLGIYKTSTMMVNSLLSIVTATALPILFSALSRLQDNNVEFNNLFFRFQRTVSLLIFPLGVGIYVFSDFFTLILLGKQWAEASDVVGIWALSSIIMIVFGHFYSEVYRAKGRPKLSFFAQIIHLLFLVPTCLIAGSYGFWILVLSRSIVRFQFVVVHLFIMKKVIGISISKSIRNTLPIGWATLIMGLLGHFLSELSEGIWWSVFSIFICMFVYISLIFTSPTLKKEVVDIIKKMTSNKEIHNT